MDVRNTLTQAGQSRPVLTEVKTETVDSAIARYDGVLSRLWEQVASARSLADTLGGSQPEPTGTANPSPPRYCHVASLHEIASTCHSAIDNLAHHLDRIRRALG